MTTLAAVPREWPKLFLGATTAIWIAVYQLLGLTGSLPVRPQSLASRAAAWARWIPGRRTFGSLLALAGLWWMSQGLAI
jgi:hypothetical protein